MCKHTTAAGFSPDWLDLREALDRNARARSIERQLEHWRRQFRSLRVLDLACGTGANARALIPVIGGFQDWTLLDIDNTLLAGIAPRMQCWAQHHALEINTKNESCTRISSSRLDACLQWQKFDLVNDLSSIDFAAFDLITASALLDLVSQAWLYRLLSSAADKSRAFLFALNYDGALTWVPSHTYDATIRHLFNRHQRSDKGFGAALGPQAAARLTAYCRTHDYAVVSGKSPWIIGSGDLFYRLAQGHAAAAKIIAPEQSEKIERWLMARLSQHVDKARIGHVDLFVTV